MPHVTLLMPKGSVVTMSMDAACGQYVSCSQKTEATITARAIGTQCAPTLLISASSQTEEEFPVTKADLVHQLARGRIPEPDTIFEDSILKSSTEIMKKAVSAKEVAAKVHSTKKRKLEQVQHRDDSTSSDEDDVVPKKLLLEEQRKNALLRRKLRTVRKSHKALQARYECLEDRHGRLEDVLLNKLGTSSCFQASSVPQPVVHRQPAEQSDTPLLHPEASPSILPADKPVLLPEAPALPSKMTPPGALHSKEAGSSVQNEAALDVQNEMEDLEPASQPGASESPGIVEQVGDQVHLSNGVFVSASQWELLLSRKKDSLFVKELTKVVWGVAALRGRSVTGTPCRRFLNTKEPGTVPMKRALTPKKLHAVGSAFDHYIAQRETGTPPKNRRSKMNRFIAEMLKDMK